MKLTALATMKIEGDIVEEFVRHTLRFVDRVILVDNESLDAAREILTQLASEGLPVIVWDGEAFPSASDGWTALARRAFATFDTEYLLMLDVDEFVRAPSRSALERRLGALAGAHALVPWVTYVPTPEDDTAEPRILARARYRLSQEPHPFSKVFVHRSFAEDPGASIAPGSHMVSSSYGRAALTSVPGIELAHIPVRTLQQIQSKALLGWPTIVAMGLNDGRPTAYQWSRLHERLLAGRNWDSNDFFRLAWHYLDENQDPPELVLDPLTPVERRYLRKSPDLLALAMEFIDQLARVNAVSAGHLSRNTQRTKSMNENGHVENGRSDNGHVENGRADIGQAGNGRVKNGQVDDGHVEYGRVDSVRVSDYDRKTVRTADVEQHLGKEAALAVHRAEAAVAAAHEAQRRAEAHAADEVQARKRADAQASLQAKLRSDALAKLAAETLRYQMELKNLQNQLREVQGLVQAMQGSTSWRLTLPLRLAVIFLRKNLKRLRRQADPGVLSRGPGS